MSRRKLDLEVHLSEETPVRTAGKVHVWLLDLDKAEFGPSGLSTLTPEELSRAMRLKDALLRRRAISRFVLVRRVLAGVTGTMPGSITFARGPRGKPDIAPTASHESRLVRFNLSHSENILAIAVASQREVGVDIEVVEEGKEAPSFYREWTEREAAAKLSGAGIALRNERPPRTPVVRSLTVRVGGKKVALAVAVPG